MRKKDSIKACGRTIEYEIVFNKKRKRAEIVVRPDLTVELRAPWGLKLEVVRTMVNDKSAWICKKLDWFEINKLPNQQKQYTEGEIYLYLGKEYTLKIQNFENIKKPFAVIRTSKLTSELTSELIVAVPEGAPENLLPLQVKKAIWDFYSKNAEEKINGILKIYSKKLGITPPVFKVKYQKRRWGSCSADNILRINFQLLMAPPEQLEYVVVHELCHIKEKNHSIKFWQLVGELMPGYEIHRKTLKKEGWQYVL